MDWSVVRWIALGVAALILAGSITMHFIRRRRRAARRARFLRWLGGFQRGSRRRRE